MIKEPGVVPNPEETADRLAITEVIHTHSRGVDRASEAILKSCYWEDAEVDYGSYKGVAWTFCETLPKAISRYEATQHTITNILIKQDGNQAAVESYVTAYHYMAREEGDTELTYLGRYLDRFERRGNAWRIAFRHVVQDWHQNTAGTFDRDNPGLNALKRGQRLPDDISSAYFPKDQ